VLTRQEVVERFESIRQAPLTRGRRAPHKPLLLLYLLGRIQRGQPARVAYREAEPKVSLLISEFGPPAGDRHRAAMPFFHLDRSLWMLDGESARPVHRELRDSDAHGTLRPEVEAALRADPALLNEVAWQLLEANFPKSYVAPICQAVGLELLPATAGSPTQGLQTRRRASDFREAVLLAYNYACAMCGFDGRLGRDPVGLQAAHVHWHALGGPDEIANGLALCDLHHTLFDRGALGLDHARIILVSPVFVASSEAARHWAEALHGRELRGPKPNAPPVEVQHIDWHRAQVFRSALG
jgi:putative restriction endonuclease